MIDALHDRPGARRAGDDRPRVRGARVERLDGEPVIGPGDEPLLERSALEHALHQLQPLLACGGRKFGGERQTPEAEDRRRMKCQFMNRLLQRHHLALAHPQAQENRAVTEVRTEQHMGAGVRSADQNIRAA